MELTPSEKDLLLCAARSAAGRVDARLTNAVLSCRPDVRRVIQSAQQHGMLPLLHRHLRETGAGPLPPETSAHFEALVTSERRQSVLLCTQLRESVDVLARAGIRAVAYKGPALATDLYGEAGLRSPDDLELLIHPRGLPRAVEALGCEGFAPRQKLSAAVLASLARSECRLLLSRNSPPSHVELHWNVVPPCFGVALDVDGIIRRAREAAAGPDAFPVPSAEDLLVCLCIDGAKDTWSRLEPVTAVSVLCRRKLDWGAVVARSRKWRAERMLLLGLSIARELLESELPDPVLSTLRQHPQLRRLTRRACLRMFETPSSGAGTVFYLRTLDRGGARWRYLARRALGPTCADVDWLGHGNLPPWLYGFVRPLRLATQTARALVFGRIEGNRER